MTNKNILTEGLDYLDFEGEIDPKITVDEYAAKMGEDSEIVTIAFTVRSEAAGNDLADWFERGYDFVLDAQVSEGEVSPGKYLVFVEMDRRTRVPERIIELLKDLKTLTGLELSDWTIIVDDTEHAPDEAALKKAIVLSPHEYRMKIEREEELNEMRQVAGIQTKDIFTKQDKDIRDFKTIAGL